jgi:hypothetical protein
MIGVKMGFWEKIGNSKNVGRFDQVVFRDTDDYGNHAVTVSENWWIWRIGKSMQAVGKLEGENKNAEIGMVFSPISIVNRIKTGEYGFKHYPS